MQTNKTKGLLCWTNQLLQWIATSITASVEVKKECIPKIGRVRSKADCDPQQGLG